MKHQGVQENTVQVRMLRDITAAFHVNLADGTGYCDGVQCGQVVTLPERDALRYEFHGIVEPVGADDETPRERLARIEHTAQAVRTMMADQNRAIQRALTETRNRTIDCGRGW